MKGRTPISGFALALEAPPIANLLLSIFFARFVKIINTSNGRVFSAGFVFGIPPWRELNSDDLFKKRYYRVRFEK